MARLIPVNLFDKPRNVRLDVNAISDIEEHCNVNVGELFKEQRLGFSVIRAMVCYGFRHEDRTMTVEKAGRLLQSALERGITLDQIMQPLAEALAGSGLFEDATTTDSDPTSGDDSGNS